MKKRMPFLLTVVIMLFIGCEKDDPISDNGDNDGTETMDESRLACFEILPEGDLYAGAWLSFNSCHEDLDSYRWDFGDGTTSEYDDPTKNYSSQGTYTVKLVVSSGEMLDSLEITIDVLRPDTIVHAVGADVDQVWDAGYHLVTGTFTLKKGNLTIMPGATILFTQGSDIYVGQEYADYRSTLTANGTADKPITFKKQGIPPYDGGWGGIRFTKYASNESSLKNCIIQDANISENYAAITMTECMVTMENCVVKDGAGDAFQLDNAGFLSFENNEISNFSGKAFTINANYVHTLGTTSTYSNVGKIHIIDNAFSNGAKTWVDHGVSYVIEKDFTIEGETDSETARLTLAEGVTIELLQNVDIWVNKNGYGILEVKGTSNNKVTITSGLETKAAGDWGILHFYDYNFNGDVLSKLDHCVVEYGGSDMSWAGNPDIKSMIFIYSTSLAVTNSTFRNANSVGFECYSGGYFREFENSMLENIPSYPIIIEGRYAQGLGAELTFSNTGNILVNNGAVDADSVLWHKQDVAYQFNGGFVVGNSDNGAVLTIEAGTKIMCSGEISVGTFDKKGKIIANGTDDPIIFTSSQAEGQQTAGGWMGIEFNNPTPGTILKNCVIEYAGGSWYEGALVFESGTSNVEVNGCTISYSEDYGMVKKNGSTPVLIGNIFTNNAREDVFESL